MARYEFKEGSSSKFWQIDLKGDAFTTTYGKIGTPGQTSLKSWKDAATAKKEHDKLVAEKTKKGYALVGKAAPAKAAPAKAAPAKAAPAKAAPAKAAPAKAAPAAKANGAGEKWNPALEKAIDADPADGDAWAVYADWLQSQGDPRGELAVVQERLLSDPKNKELLAAEKKLLKDHRDALVGIVGKYMCRSGKKDIPGITRKPDLVGADRISDYEAAPVRVGWRAGFFASAFISYPGEDWSPASDKGEDDDDDGGGSVDMRKLLDEVLTSPAARFLTSLNIGMANEIDEGQQLYGPVIKKLATIDALTRLRSLYIGDVGQEESEVSWLEIGDLSSLWPKLSKLRSLTVRGASRMKLGAIALPELRELTIITGGLEKKNVASICAAKWPKLEKLELWFGSNGYGANTTMKDLQPLLDGKAFPALKHLGLRNCELADDLAAALPKAKIVKQLEALDLSKGTMTGAGVKALVEGKAAFAHLGRLDLSDNHLTAADEKLASGIMRQVRTKPQRKPSEYNGEIHRYVALGE